MANGSAGYGQFLTLDPGEQFAGVAASLHHLDLGVIGRQIAQADVLTAGE